MKIFTFFLFVFMLNYTADASVDVPGPFGGDETAAEVRYEECDCYNREITNRVTKSFLSKSDVDCVNCSHNKAHYADDFIQRFLRVEGAAIDAIWGDPAGDVSPTCIYASTKKTNKSAAGIKQYRVCLKDRKTYYQKSSYKACGKMVYPRRYCLNEAYISMTTKALNDVGKCVGIAPKNLFPLFNHESRFVLNNRSPTGAMCYGQLTADTVETLNNYNRLNFDYYSNGNNKSLSSETVDSLRLDNILNNCPKVAEKFKKLQTKRVKTKKGNTAVTYKGVDSFCDVVENPYTCLMYSAINHKMNLEYAKMFVSRATVWPSTNKKGGKQIIHKDKDTMVLFQNKLRESPDWNYLRYEERSIFKNPSQVAELAALFAYNGGPRTIKTLFADYVRNLQRRLDNSNNKKLRKIFFDGGIDTTFFYKEFKNYIATYYKWGSKKSLPGRKKEVSGFVDKIIRDLNHVVDHRDEKKVLDCASSLSFISKSVNVIHLEGVGM